jgi:hypothetical protein
VYVDWAEGSVGNGGVSERCNCCGVHLPAIWGVCEECGLQRNHLNRLIEANHEAVLFVGGAGYGVGGAYSDTFHALADDLSASVCGRIEASSGGTAATGIQWREGVLTVQATEAWQSTLCGACEQQGAFEAHKIPPSEAAERAEAAYSEL